MPMNAEQKKILIVEDDFNFGNILKDYLILNDYFVVLAKNGIEGMEKFQKENFDLCILDVMMPFKDGFTLGKEIREKNETIPLFFLSAKTLKEDVLRGFKIGADDYLTKPFDSEVLLAKIKAILNRKNFFNVPESDVYEFEIGKFKFNSKLRFLSYVDKEPVKLSPKENQLLRLLMLHVNDLLPRELALNKIWRDDNYFTSRSMDVYIAKLRKYLKSDSNVVEDKIQIVRNDKILNLITRLVVQKTDSVVLGYVLTFDDITSLIAAQKMGAWSDIARRIAHEIKNPLTPIRLSAERLKNKLNNGNKIDKKIFEQSLDMITRQVDDIHHLVNEFSSFARMPSPKLKLINIYNVITDYIKPLSSSFDNVTVEVDNKIDNALIMADEKQIRQACNNLIKNSYENITLNKINDGKIIICFGIENDFVTITITDNGTGIDKSIISKILEPYYTTKVGNSGLGLAITKKIIDDHNGIILFKQLKLSKGTTVVLKFPLISKLKKEKNK